MLPVLQELLIWILYPVLLVSTTTISMIEPPSCSFSFLNSYPRLYIDLNSKEMGQFTWEMG